MRNRQPSPDRRNTILFVIGSLDIGGAESQLTMLAVELRKRGWGVIVFALDADGPLRAVLETQDCKVVGGGYSSRRSGRVAKIAALLRAQLALASLTVREKVHVVHGFLPLTNFMASLAGRLTFRSVVVTSRRGLGTHQGKHPYLRWMDHVSNRLSTAVTANSQAVADDVACRDRYERSWIAVIGNGLDFERVEAGRVHRGRLRSELGLKPDELGIVKLANLIPYKGHNELIDAFAVLSRVDERLRLFLVGEDRGLLDTLLAKSLALGVGERVRFLGRRQDVPALLGAMDIGVMASHEEGFSNALLEKLAAGLPVVATDVGGNPEALRDMPNCPIVPVCNAAKLAEGLRTVIDRLPESEDIVMTRKSFVNERYAIQSMVDAYETLYYGTK